MGFAIFGLRNNSDGVVAKETLNILAYQQFGWNPNQIVSSFDGSTWKLAAGTYRFELIARCNGTVSDTKPGIYKAVVYNVTDDQVVPNAVLHTGSCFDNKFTSHCFFEARLTITKTTMFSVKGIVDRQNNAKRLRFGRKVSSGYIGYRNHTLLKIIQEPP